MLGHRKYTYSFARNDGQNQGHNSLFVMECQIIEAEGSGKTVHPVNSANHVVRSRPEYRGRIKTPKSVTNNQRYTAALFARRQIGKPYNDQFWNNRKVEATHSNCSQLVWAAWMYAAKIDLDNDGKGGVCPEDLWKSSQSWLVRYMEKA